MKNKTGLILEGGGMRGIFTAGVLDAFLDFDIEFDNCIGVSAGACHASSYLCHQRKRSFKISTDYLNDKRYCSIYSFIKTGDLFGVDFIYNEIPNKLNIIDKKYFEEKNKTKFEVVITNIDTGLPEYKEIKNFDDDTKYIRASSSLPLLARVVEIDKNHYLDGALGDSLPIKHNLSNGIKRNIVILTRPRGYRKKPNKYTLLFKNMYKKYEKVSDLISKRYINYNESLELIESLEDSKKIFVIRPPFDLNIRRTEKNYDKLKKAYNLGYDITKSQIEYIKDYLK